MNRAARQSPAQGPSQRVHSGAWLLAALCLWLWSAPQAIAHPHAWIDIVIVFETNPEDEVTGIAQTWIIDPTYSRYLHDDAMAQFEGATPEEKLANLGAEILDNLGEYHWYTEVHADDRAIAVRPEGPAELVMRDRQIRFQFRLTLAEPVDPRTQTLRYAVYDPTYFIEVLHEPTTPPRLELSTGPCRLDILKPRPDPMIVARALALDYNQTGEADLGRHFAEKVTAHCD
jgi:ABC-type uncharacterized transport system substrate-binding protein